MIKLHPIQKALLDLMKEKDVNKMSFWEIGRVITKKYNLKANHAQIIKHHLHQLISKGFIKQNEKGQFVPVDNTNKNNNLLISIPILGAANCGDPTAVAEEEVLGYLKISKSLIKQDPKFLFAVKAIGNSMNRANIKGENIEDGDYVIVNYKDKTLNDGDYILSVIDGLANIKRVKIDKKNGIIKLISESTEEHPPIYITKQDIDANTYLVNGKVVMVVKK